MLFCNLSFSQERKFKKNYNYLKSGEFVKVYKNLNDIRSKDSTSPFLFYLMSLYFGDKNNPVVNIDSSYLYLKKSFSLTSSYTDKKELDESCEEIKFCILNLPAQLDSISNVAYEICMAKNDITSLTLFIDLYKGTFEESKAMKRLDQLIYYKAKENQSIPTLESFIANYPNSDYIDSAKKNIENISYLDAIKKDEIDIYNRFLKKYPSSNVYSEIELKRDKKAFDLAALSNTETGYNTFISTYPKSTLVREAITKRDKIVYDEAKTKNDLITYKSVLQKYPDIEYAKDINELILKFEKVLTDSTVVKSDMNKVITLSTPNGDKLVAITVSGSGKTQDEAKQVALRSAIEQAFGTFISSKTEILNDQVVTDEIASVANGNIQSFTILNESQLPDGTWGVTLKAIVSVDKLTSFVEAKGIAIEIKGGMFAMNIKQQLLNEQGEIKAVSEMVGLLHEPMQISFDYVIKSSDPKSLDAESKNWEIPLDVTATTNKNIDFCANYCVKTLAALSLSSEEVTTYLSLNKAVFPVVINYKGIANTFYLRKKSSINALKTLTSNWEFYTRLFTVQSGMDESNGKGEGQIHEFSKINYDYNQNIEVITINFLSAGQQAATFTWQDKRTLSQIEQMTDYKVKPRGVVSKFKYGGFVVKEYDGQGLVAAITDLGLMDFNSAKTACEELILNGYTDWHLPSKDELNAVYFYLYQNGIGFINKSKWDKAYWSCSTEYDSYYNSIRAYFIDFDSGHTEDVPTYEHKYDVRAVRRFGNVEKPMTDQMPEFPGGKEALFAYIGRNLKYPQQAVDANTVGVVTINFDIDVDGSITNVKLANGIGYGCDEEAIRLVNSFPKWNPAKKNGKNVKVQHSLPFTFQLD
jgi:TonB family protein